MYGIFPDVGHHGKSVLSELPIMIYTLVITVILDGRKLPPHIEFKDNTLPKGITSIIVVANELGYIWINV